MEIETTNMLFKPLQSYLSFPNIAEKKLKRKSKQNIPRYIDLIYRLFNIILGSNWLIVSLVQNGGTIT